MNYPNLVILFLIFSLTSLFSNGFLLIVNPPAKINPFTLEVKNHNVNVKIDETISETEVDQTFYNPTNRTLEGNYLFPIPRGAVIKNFTMFINGVETKAELLDANKAKQIYEDIVRKQLDPALLEYNGCDLFKVRVFPIEPRSDKRIKISYTEVLNKDMGTVEYIYNLSGKKFSSLPVKNLTINLEIRSKNEIKNIYSPTHKLEIIKKSKNFVLVSYEDVDIKSNNDLKLYYDIDDRKMGVSLLTHKEKDEDGFFLLNITPSIDFNQNEVEEKDVTFVFDSSGSMSGKNLSQAKEALKFCINNLDTKDRFDVIRFSTEAEALFGKLTDVNRQTREKSSLFIDKIEAIGGTNMEDAFKLALSNNDNTERLHLVVFITDGKPTIGETDENLLIKSIKNLNKDKIRIFTFGIGYEINTHLLDKITNLTKAYSSYILPEENIEVKISNFFLKVKSPVLTDIKLTIKDGIKISKIYPKEIPDLFRGSSVNLLGIYEGNGDTEVILEGNVGKKRLQFNNKFNFTNEKTKNDFIPKLWATRRVGYLLELIRLNKEEKEIVDEIVYLSKKYGIVTPYTSYLILEDQIRQDPRRIMGNDFEIFKKDEVNKMYDTSKKSYDTMRQEKSGKNGVMASRELQDLNMVNNLEEQQRQNFINISNYKNIHNRIFYQDNKYWVDAKINSKDKKERVVIRVQFASEKYFDLIKQNDEIGGYLSLGKNVRFLFDNQVYEIYE